MTNNGSSRYPAGAIANFMLDTARHDRVPVTHLKLQKLVYMAYGMSTLFVEEPLFGEEIQAWRYGPVVPDLWHEFKAYRWRPIKGRSLEYDPDHDRVTRPVVDSRDTEINNILDLTWERYGYVTAATLVSLTHANGTPWAETVEQHDGEFGHPIDPKLIAAHFDVKFGDLRGKYLEQVENDNAFLNVYYDGVK